MSGDWLLDQLGSSDSSTTAAPAPAAAPTGDPAIWTVLGEAGGDTEGQRAVASTIYHRQTAGKYNTPAEVVADPANGYQPWQEKASDLQRQYPVGSDAYKTAQATVGDILSGKAPPPYPYTHFHADSMKVPPKWATGDGVDIGGNKFYELPLSGSRGMTADERATWNDLQGSAPPPTTRVTFDKATGTYRDASGKPYTFPTSEGHLTDAGGGEFRIVPPEEASSVKNGFSNLGQGTIEAPVNDAGFLSIPAAAIRTAANGITGGWADKASALAGVMLNGGDFSKALDREQAISAQDRSRFPVTSGASGALGNVAQSFLLPELKAAGLGGRTIQGMAQGGALGMVNGTGQARGTFQEGFNQAVPAALEGVATGGVLNAALGPTNAAPSALRAYDTAGMQPSLAMLGGPSTQRLAGALRGVPLISHPLNQVAERETAGINTRLTDLAGGYGQSTNAYQAGTSLQEGAATARDNLKAGVDQAYAGVNRYEASPTLVPATNTQQTIASAFSKYPNLQEWFQSHSPVLSSLNTALTKTGGQLTFGELKALRTDVGGMIDGHSNDVNTIDRASLKSIYGALTKDMEGGIQKAAYQDAIAAGSTPVTATKAGALAQRDLATANAANAKMRDTMESTLLPIMDAKTPEAAYQKLVAAAQGGTGRSDFAGLLRAKAALPPDAWGEVAAGSIATMGRNANGDFSAATFLTQLNKMDPRGRSALFGASTPGLNALEEIARNQVRGAKFLNHSNSGNVVGLLGEGGALGVAAQQAANGNWAPAMVTALTGAGGLAASHLLASPGFARLMVGVSKFTTPSAIDSAFEKFAAANPRIAPELATFRNRLSTIAASSATTAEGNSLLPMQTKQKAP